MPIVRTIGGIMALIGIALFVVSLFIPLNQATTVSYLFVGGGLLFLIGFVVLIIGSIAHF